MSLSKDAPRLGGSGDSPSVVGRYEDLRRPAKPPRSRDFVIPACILVYSLYTASSVFTLPYERLAFGLVFVSSGLIAVFSKAQSIPTGARKLAILWVTVVLLYGSASLVQIVWSPSYVFGDLLLALLPIVITFAFLGNPAMYGVQVLYFVVVSQAVSAVEAQWIGDSYHRHDPPSAFLIAAAWYLFLFGRSRSRTLAGGFLVLITGYLAYTSGYRTHLVLWLLAPILVLFVLRGLRWILFGIGCLTCTAILFAVAGHSVDVTQSLNDTRFNTIVSSQPDISVDTRLANCAVSFRRCRTSGCRASS